MNGGGRLFVSHLHFFWLRNRPADLGTTAAPYMNMDPLNDVTLTINQTFPKGMAFAQWLNSPAVAATTALGQLPVRGSEYSVSSVNPPTTDGSTYNSPRAAQYLSFNTPVGTPEDMQCGKVVFTDIHIQTSVPSGGITTGGDDSDPGQAVPERVQDQRDVAAGQGARVPVLRSFGLRAAGRRRPGAAARAAARRAVHAAAPDPGAAAGTAGTPPGTTTPPPPTPPPPPPPPLPPIR